MTDDAARPAEAARERLGAALKAAMKARDQVTVAVARSLLSALDNRSAVPLADHPASIFVASAETARHDPTQAEIAQVFDAEAAEREAAAADYDRRGLSAEAARLRAEIAIIAQLRSGSPAGGG